MSKASKLLFIVAGVLGATAILVVAYIWIGSQVFGLNTSRLDPTQGLSWPMDVVVWSLIGAFFALAGGIVMAVASERKTPPSPNPR